MYIPRKNVNNHDEIPITSLHVRQIVTIYFDNTQKEITIQTDKITKSVKKKKKKRKKKKERKRK